MTEEHTGPTVDDLPALERLLADNARHLETLQQQGQELQRRYENHLAHGDILTRQVTVLQGQRDAEAQRQASLQAMLEDDTAANVEAMRRVHDADMARQGG